MPEERAGDDAEEAPPPEAPEATEPEPVPGSAEEAVPPSPPDDEPASNGPESDEEKEPSGPEPPFEVDSEDRRAAVVMGVIFVGTILLAMVIAQALEGEVQPVFEDPQNPTNPLIYLGLVVVFTLGILLVAKLGLQRIIQVVILAAVFFTLVYVFEPLLSLVLPLSSLASLGVSVGIAGVLTIALYAYPEWYVVDAAGISVAAGATGWFGFSFGIVPALVLLIAFAVYDAIAVYRTEHMLDLADEVMDLRLPIMLVIPKIRGYSFLDQKETIEAESDDGGRDALFMGLGDIVIPGVLVVSALMFLGDYAAPYSTVFGLEPALFVALTTLIGATVGFGVLMRGVLKGSPHAGLPALNGGALLGFLIPVLWLYGTAPFIPQF